MPLALLIEAPGGLFYMRSESYRLAVDAYIEDYPYGYKAGYDRRSASRQQREGYTGYRHQSMVMAIFSNIWNKNMAVNPTTIRAPYRSRASLIILTNLNKSPE